MKHRYPQSIMFSPKPAAGDLSRSMAAAPTAPNANEGNGEGNGNGEGSETTVSTAALAGAETAEQRTARERALALMPFDLDSFAIDVARPYEQTRKDLAGNDITLGWSQRLCFAVVRLRVAEGCIAPVFKAPIARVLDATKTKTLGLKITLPVKESRGGNVVEGVIRPLAGDQARWAEAFEVWKAHTLRQFNEWQQKHPELRQRAEQTSATGASSNVVGMDLGWS